MPLRDLGLTGEQIRAARALARIEQTELAGRTRLSLETIKRLERIRGVVEANSRTIAAIREAFEALGIVFDSCESGGVGVCRVPPDKLGEGRSPTTVRAAPQATREAVGGLHRLTYHSTASPEIAGRMKVVLDDVVGSAGKQNPDLGVSGVLLACNGRFLQALEGPKDAVRQVFGAISSDPRHGELRVIENRPVAGRTFHDWSMCCGLFSSDEPVLGQEPALSDGFRPEQLSPAGALGLLSVLRDLQRLPPRSRRGEAGKCPLAEACLDRTCAASAADRAPAA